MSLELAIAAAGCFVLALGHTAIGRRQVLPALAAACLSSRTLSMVRFTWYVVSGFLVAFGVLLAILAAAPDADTRTLLLRWLAVLWLAAAARAFWDARRRLSSVVRFPVPVVFLVIAAMCWAAAA